MNWAVCTKLAIISVRNCIKGHFDPSDKKGGGTSVVICFVVKKTYSSITLFFCIISGNKAMPMLRLQC